MPEQVDAENLDPTGDVVAAPVVAGGAAELGAVRETAARARDYLRAARSPNTLRAYRADWADFTGWCAMRRLDPLPAEPATVALYLTDLAETCKPSTLQRRISAISQAHSAAGHPPPTQSHVVRGVWPGSAGSRACPRRARPPP